MSDDDDTERAKRRAEVEAFMKEMGDVHGTMLAAGPLPQDVDPDDILRVHYIARFLGANSSAWTRTHRERLRRILTDLGTRATIAVVSTIVSNPRTDVIDEAVLVLRHLPNAKLLLRLLANDKKELSPAEHLAIRAALDALEEQE